jgi:RNA polymerase sigma factor (sigma-70 family)
VFFFRLVSMSTSSQTTTLLQNWIDRIQAGDDSARDELLVHFERRFRTLGRRKLHGSPGVHRWEQTDDVLQDASMRLLRTLKQIRPESVASFLNLASVHIRRTLIDLYRHHNGKQGQGAHHATTSTPTPDGERHTPAHERTDDTWEPSKFLWWAELHEEVARLPEPEREVFGLLYYQGLTQEEAGTVLNVSRRTVIRYWQSAQLKLRESVKQLPNER